MRLTPVEIARIAYRETGWRGENLVIAVAVALGESEGDPKAHNPRYPDDSYGLWQINYVARYREERVRKYGPPESQYDPAHNARSAYALWLEQGWRGWGAYNSGAYKDPKRRCYERAQEGVAQMARLVGSLQTLRSQVNAAAPNRDKSSDGWIGDPAHASRPSDHNPEPDETVDALDIDHDPANGCDVDVICEAVRASRDPRLKYMIRRGRICSGRLGPRAWVWRDRGKDPDVDHALHAHFSVLDEGQDDTSPWDIGLQKGLTLAEVTRKEFETLRDQVGDIWKAVLKTVDHDGDPKTPKRLAEHLELIDRKLDELLGK